MGLPSLAQASCLYSSENDLWNLNHYYTLLKKSWAYERGIETNCIVWGVVMAQARRLRQK